MTILLLNLKLSQISNKNALGQDKNFINCEAPIASWFEYHLLGNPKVKYSLIWLKLSYKLAGHEVVTSNVRFFDCVVQSWPYMDRLSRCVTAQCSRYMSRVMRKPVFRVSDQVQHSLGCTATEDG